ncbi:crotonase/enoyl-CoA hydratase family protein [Oceanobacillus sp. CF4.6]|uniref:crotonase/enoyl-CoA hydratase family protein n=1 Tax=Oceanobacillus sp. CF4.6 TaxID=3373080 RepID=UPI003EE6772F
MYETIRVEVSERIMTITLHRPEQLNAYTHQMQDELIHAFDRADEDDNVRVIIMTGSGRAYCAGADLHEYSFDVDEPMEEHRDGGGVLTLRIFELKKPIIAAINGAAVGIGATMVLPMDIRIASDVARIGFVFSRRGITQEAGSGWFLPRVVGINQAMEWIATGRIFSAEEALEKGLISRVVPEGKLLDTARNLAREIAENTSAMSVALNRQLMWKMLGTSHPMISHKIESKFIYWMGKNADVKEGMNAFLEKRKPNFTMNVSSDMPDFYPWKDMEKFKD